MKGRSLHIQPKLLSIPESYPSIFQDPPFLIKHFSQTWNVFCDQFFIYFNIVSMLCQCCVKYQYGSPVYLVNNFSLWSLSFYRIFLLSVIFLLPLILAMLSWLESSSFFPVSNRVSFEFQYSRLFDILCSFDILFHCCQLFSRVNDNLNPVLNDIV